MHGLVLVESGRLKIVYSDLYTVKPVLSGNPKVDKTKILVTNGSLMKVESIAKCFERAFCNTLCLHLAILGIENQFLVF